MNYQPLPENPDCGGQPYAGQPQPNPYGGQPQPYAGQPQPYGGQPAVGAVVVPVAAAYIPGGGSVQHRPPLQLAPFSTGLCDCFMDCDSCLDATFCHWCQLANQYDMINQGTPTMNIGFCLAILCGDCFYGLGSFIGALWTRSEARKRYLIASECLIDCAAAFCCTPCSIAQVQREMSIRGYWPGGVFANSSPSFTIAPQRQAM